VLARCAAALSGRDCGPPRLSLAPFNDQSRRRVRSLLPTAPSTAPAADEQVSVARAPEDGAAGEVAAMLRSRKKKRRQAERQAFEGDYVPLDPMDWRAKMS
jgi:hypothetical protein